MSYVIYLFKYINILFLLYFFSGVCLNFFSPTDLGF